MQRASSKLDSFDLKILAALQRSGRMTKVDLADAIGLSPSPCLERLKRLESSGFITAYHADINMRRITNISHILTSVTLRSHRAPDCEKFERAIAGTMEITECYATGGEVDYFLKCVVIDIDHYQRVIGRMLEDSKYVDKFFSYIVTKVVVPWRGYPLDHLLQVSSRNDEAIPPEVTSTKATIATSKALRGSRR